MNMTSANKSRRSFFSMILAAITATPAVILAAIAAAKAATPAKVVVAVKAVKPVKVVAVTAPKAFMKDGIFHVPMPKHLMDAMVRVRPGDKDWIG